MGRIRPVIGTWKAVAPWKPFLRASIIIFLSFVLTLLCIVQAKSEPVLGDYDAEPRSGGHVDTDRLVQRLSDLGANTYMWLVWHSANDWEDLAVFLPKAKQAGITVWVYLVPHSETAVQHPRWPYSEPFRLDYIRWAEEIAKLSLRYPNLIGYVIDDFWYNVSSDRFSPDYIRRMVTAGKAINPKLKFYPLMYFGEIGGQHIEVLAPLIDGIVAAYPPDRTTVETALMFLEDRIQSPGSATAVFPRGKSSQLGDHGMVFQEARVTGAKPVRLSFRYRDNFDGPTEGYHRLQLRVDGQVIWEEDASGHDDDTVTVDLATATNGKRTVRLSMGIFDVKGVYNFGIEASFADLRTWGLEMKDPNLGNGAAWSQDISGAFSMQFVQERVGTERFRLPLIVILAGEAGAYKHRYHEEGTPENIASRIKMMTDLAQEGRIEGVVTYCLDKHEGSATFEAERKIFESVRKKEK